MATNFAQDKRVITERQDSGFENFTNFEIDSNIPLELSNMHRVHTSRFFDDLTNKYLFKTKFTINKCCG